MLIEQTAAQAPASSPARDLVAEANHRIANSLSALAALVQHQMASFKPDRPAIEADDVRDMLGELRAKVDAVARFHRALSDLPADAPIDVGRYLQQIVSELVSTLSRPDTVVFQFIGEPGCRVAPERALYLGLIVVELVTNSLKYAHPSGVQGRLALRCWRASDAVVVEVSDDGVGFPDGFDPAQGTSGLRIVRSLVKQIGGSLAFDSDGLGVTCTIRAPVLVVV